MRQLIARIDDDLHAQLKQRAAAEGRSLNSLVTEALERFTGKPDRRTAREILAEHGMVANEHGHGPPDPERTAELIAQTRGIGPIAQWLIDDDRGPHG